MKKQLTELVDFWKKNRFSQKTLPKVPRPIFLSLLFICVYLSLATLSIPTTCSPKDRCTTGKQGAIFIRPFMGAPNINGCQMNAPNFPAGTPITESLLTRLNQPGVTPADIFADGGSTDKTKWQIIVKVTSLCDEDCDEDKEPHKFERIFSKINVDYEIVSINTSNTPGFAIKLKDLPVSDPSTNRKKSHAITVHFLSPCVEHLSNNCTFCADKVDPNVFRLDYSAVITRTEVMDTDEVRLHLIPSNSATNQDVNCGTCK